MSDPGVTPYDKPVPAVACAAPHNCGQVDVAFYLQPGESWGWWQGHRVSVDNGPAGTCPDGEHELDVVHYGVGGHFCPTGFLMCYRCAAVGFEPAPHQCHVWQNG